MADERYRRTTSANPAPPNPGARRVAVSAAAPRPAGPDPLVELARLIGQNEGPAHDPPRVPGRREEGDVSGQPTKPRQRPAPTQPPAASPADHGGGFERQPDQRYSGYTEPKPPTPQVRGQAPRAPAAPAPPSGASDSPPVEAARPPPPPKGQAARADQMAPAPPVREGEGRRPVERAPARASEPAPPVAGEKRRPQAPAGGDYARPPSAEKAHAPAAGRGDSSAAAKTNVPPAVSAYAPRADRRPAPPAGRAYAPPAERGAVPPTETAYAPPGQRGAAPPVAKAYAPAADRAAPPARKPSPARGYETRESYDDGQRAGAAPDDEYGYDYSGRDYEAGEPRRSRKLPLAIAILSLAVIGTAGAYGYRVMFAGTTQEMIPPVIRADTSPKKVASTQAGDKQVQEQVSNKNAGEQMVSREEQPLAIKDPAARPLPSFGPSGEPPAVGAPATTDPGGARSTAGSAAEPKKVKTVTIRPESGANDVPPAAPAARAPAPTAPAAAPAPAATAPARTQPPRQQVAVATQPSGGYVVQLSAQKSEADAQASFRTMQAKYPSVLSGRKSIIRRKENASKGVYFGAQVGPFASREEAHQLCEQLKAAGGACFVEKN